MIIGSTGNQVKSLLNQGFCQNLRVADHLFLIILELRLGRFFKTYRLCRDYMLQRSALRTRKDCFVDGFGVFLLAENQAASRSSQSFMGSAGHNIRVFYRIRMMSGSDKPRDVGHVHHQDRADLIGDLSEFIRFNGSRIRGRPRYNQLWLML